MTLWPLNSSPDQCRSAGSVRLVRGGRQAPGTSRADTEEGPVEMGYYTEFEMTVDWADTGTDPDPRDDRDQDDLKAEVLVWARAQWETDDRSEFRNPDGTAPRWRVYDPICEDEDSDPYAKWYDHERDMARLSLVFPQYEVTLTGKGESCEGEDEWDQWTKRFVNGRMWVSRVQSVQLIWSEEREYDPTVPLTSYREAK